MVMPNSISITEIGVVIFLVVCQRQLARCRPRLAHPEHVGDAVILTTCGFSMSHLASSHAYTKCLYRVQDTALIMDKG